MTHVNDLKSRLLAYIKRRHTGQHNAAPSRALEARFCVCGSTVRRTVLILRRSGEPICSSQNGYYYAANGQEVWETIGRLERRIAGTVQVVKGMRTAASKQTLSGQTRLQI